VQDVPGEIIAWNVIGSQLFRGTGLVRFLPSTLEGHVEVTLEQCINPALSMGTAVNGAVMRGCLEETLQNFKRLFETGEIGVTQGQLSARRFYREIQ